MIFNLYKERGETPLERIERFVKENPNLKSDFSPRLIASTEPKSAP